MLLLLTLFATSFLAFTPNLKAQDATSLRGRTIGTLAPTDTQAYGWNAAARQWRPLSIVPQSGSSNYCLPASGSGTAYTCTLTPTLAAYGSGGLLITFKPDTTNTGAATLNIDSLGNKDIQKVSGGALAAVSAGDLFAGAMYTLLYNGSVFVVQLGTSGSGTVAVQAAGVAVGSRGTLNFIAGTGVTQLLSDTGVRIDITDSIDTSVVQTHANYQAGSDILCAPAGASGTTFTCNLNSALTAYTSGMLINFKPDVAASGTPTLNINSLGAKTLRLADGTTTPTATDLPAGQMRLLWYDGTFFRLVQASSSLSTIDITTAGSASTSPIKGSGAFFTGGSSTTTKPYFLIEPTGAMSTGWSTNGTAIGANAASGFTGNLIDAQLNGTSSFKVDQNGAINGQTTASRVLYTTTNGKPTTDAALTFDGTTLYSASRITSGGDVRLGGGNVITAGLTDGNLTLYNSAASDFGRINLGGTTSSFPALKRSTTTLQARLADDSDYADVRARGVQFSTGTRPTCNSTNRGYTWYVAGGAGVADTFEVCRKDASDVYAWVTLF